MELVIKIPEGIYRRISQKYRYLTLDDIGLKTFDKVCVAIKDGTPIPKGHGRLIDENELIDEIVCEEIDGRYYDVIYAHSIYDANTIIEADKEK